MGKKLHEVLSKQFANGWIPTQNSPFHLIVVFSTLLVTIIIAASFWKWRKNSKTTFFFLLTIWVFMAVIETLKQFEAGSHLDASGNWYWKYVGVARWAFPFVLCSMPLYFIPLYLATVKTKKFKIWILDFITLFSLYGGMFVLIYPGDVFTRNIFTSYHSSLYHGSMAVIGLVLLIWRVTKYNWKTMLRAFAVFMCLWAFTGFANEMIWQASSKDINDPNIPTLLHISHRLPIHFATTISQMTKGKFHMTSVQFYFFYTIYTLFAINVFFWIFGGIAQLPYGIIKLNNYLKIKRLEKFELKRQEFARNNSLNY